MSKQKMIPGTVDEPPPAVRECADKYLNHKRAIAAGREKMNAAKDELIGLMQENDVAEMLIDDGEKKLILTEESKLKVEARKKSSDGLDKGYEQGMAAARASKSV